MSTSESVRLCGLTESQMIEMWNLHQKYEFDDKDVDKTMETMNEQPFITHVPTMAGGSSKESIKRFYATNFIPCNPPDIKTELVSRTVGETQLVDELICSFTHSCPIPWMLPDIAPTNKFIRVALVVIVGFSEGKVCKEHIHWDQGSVMLQAGLIQKTVSNNLPVFGSETVDCVLHQCDPIGPTN